MMSQSRMAAAAALAILGAANLAAAPSAAPDPKASVWASKPTSEQFHQAVPSGAMGRAVLRCHVEATGALSDCRVAAESPAGQGFAQAALSLMPAYRLKPEAIKTEAPTGEAFMTESWFEADGPTTWLRKPSPEDLLVVWPKKAWREGRGGKAVINCLISLQGSLYDCVAVAESPAGENFGAAAIALTPQLLMKPATLHGKPVIGVVNVPINFIMPPGSSGGGDGGRKLASAAMAWPEAPSYADIAAAYPKKARAAGLAGHATVDCEFESSGHLGQCHVLSEEPKGQGFGDAARALTKKFRAFPTGADGKPITGGGVQLPFAFDPAVLGDEKPAIGKPQWAGLPSVEDTRAAFGALTKTVTGTVRVALSCTVQAGGGVGDCKVTREDPPGQGVGEAALALASHVRVTTWTMEGLPTVGGTISIPLRYEAGAAPAPAPAPAKP